MSGAGQFTDSGESGERLADAGERLERAYGRLLRWYPAGHQARHGDEMLGVLMAGAGSGRRGPGLADSANLIGGALRIRLRAATTGSAGRWREALAQAGILLPLAWLAGMVLAFGADMFVLNWTLLGASGTLSPSPLANYVQDYLPPIVVLITMLLGWRRLALAAIAAAVIAGPGDIELRHLMAPQPYDAAYLTVMVIAALAVVAGSGRARSLLTWKHYVLTIAVAVAAGGAAQQLENLGQLYSVPAPVAELAALAVVAAITVILLVGSAASRRLLIISAVPLYFYVVVILTPVYRSASLLIDLPLVALAGAAVLLAAARARAWRRRAAAGGNA